MVVEYLYIVGKLIQQQTTEESEDLGIWLIVFDG